MFEYVPYKREHITMLLDQKMNEDTRQFFTPEALTALETQECGTAMVNGVPYWCGGIAKCWEGRGMIWSVFNEESKKNFLPLFRGLKKVLEKSPYRRLEVAIPFHFQQGKRRAELLGFRLECDRAKKFLPNGEDCSLYALVRK